MKKIKAVSALIIAIVCAFCLFAFTSSAADEGTGKWITTWSTAPTEIGIEGYDSIVAYIGDITARTVITPSASGTELRVKFSNCYGKEPLVISKATVAVSTGDSGINTDTLMYLTFSGKPGISIPAGQEVYSDAVPFVTHAGEKIAVSTYLKEFSEVRTMGLSGGDTYLTMGNGYDMADAVDFNILNGLEIEDQWVYDMLDKLLGSILNSGTLEIPVSYNYIQVVPALASVEVLSPNDEAYSVVMIGDSTISGDLPYNLAKNINAQGITDIGISDKGLIGNSLIGEASGLGSLVYGEALVNRMKREIVGLDGLNQSNVKYVIVKIGVNDIIHPVCTDTLGGASSMKQPTAKELIAGFQQVFDFCHSYGIKVIAVSVTQWGNDKEYYSTGKRYNRTAAQFAADRQIAKDVNEWLSSTAAHDGYIDLATVSANPEDPDSILPDYTIDGTHPSQVLQKLWSDTIPLSLIGVTNRVAHVGLSETDIVLYRNESKRLTATVSPENAINKAVTWKSSDPSVVSVDAFGNLKALKKGQATISVKTDDNGYSGVGYEAKCKVTVKVRPDSMKIVGESNILYTTKAMQLTAEILPADVDTEFKALRWSSSDEKVATVDKNGLVTAVGKGTAVISAVSAADEKITASYTVTVKKKISVQSVNLNLTEKTKNVNTVLRLYAEINPSNATFPEVTWTSSDPKVATVDKNGKVKTLKEGVTVITCKSVDNPMCKATCIVTVKVKTTGLRISNTKLSMYVSQVKSLKATVLPADATNKNVTWKSSDSRIASVSKTGQITAKKPGTCVITVKTKNGGFVKKCKVTVKKYIAAKSYKLNKTSLVLNDGKTFNLKAKFTPSNASNKGLVWSSSNKNVATVSSKGKVKGINPGTCIITCKSKDTGKKITVKVKIKKVKVKAAMFDEKIYTVEHNRKLKLGLLIYPSNATNQKVKWKSSHPEYVKVNKKGVVKGVALGKTATITATTADGKKVATCQVKVSEVELKTMKLNKTSATVGVGGVVTLTPIFTPANVSEKAVRWTTSDEKIATVSSEGVVTPIKDGTVKIMCITEEGGLTAECTIVVKTVKTTGITLDKSSINADKGAVFNLNATVEPADASNKKIVWTSTSTTVATVTSNGQVTAVGKGVCYIKAMTESGRYTATCKITVTE